MGALKTVRQTLEKMGGKRVYFDTVLFIYGLENSPEYASRAIAFIQSAQERQIIGITGIATLTEMLVHPFRDGNDSYADQLKTLFLSGDVCECVSHTDDVFLSSARLRAKSKLKAIDALHFSTALHFGCQYFLTNDTSFKSTQTMEVVRLSDLTVPKK